MPDCVTVCLCAYVCLLYDKAGALVTDYSPMVLGREWREAVANSVKCPMFEVLAHTQHVRTPTGATHTFKHKTRCIQQQVHQQNTVRPRAMIHSSSRHIRAPHWRAQKPGGHAQHRPGVDRVGEAGVDGSHLP